jgi:hypothetical protein
MSVVKNASETPSVNRANLFYNTGLPILKPLVGQTRIGSFWYLGIVAIGTTDTTLPHKLGRIPSGYILWRAQVAGSVYDGSHDGSDWTSSEIVLRATVAGNYGILVG